MQFVYEPGPNPVESFVIDMNRVAELLQVSDTLFMPRHREGFGMPVLEAGLVGIPAFCSNIGGEEIVGQGVIRFSPEADPDQVASLIAIWMKLRSVLHPRRHIRRDLTWHSIFQREILPLLDHGGVS